MTARFDQPNKLDAAAGLLGLLAAGLLTLAWRLCPLPDLLRRGDDAITAADLGTVD